MVISVAVTLTLGSWAARKDISENIYGMHIDYWMHVVSFTVLSNILLGLIALVASIIGFDCYQKQKALPRKLLTWYLIGATSGVLTCLTVIFFLSPMRVVSGKGYFDMLLGPMFHLHFFNPLLAAISYIFFTGQSKATQKERWLSVLPPVIYAAPYIICVVILHIWPDFYGLTFGGRNYLIFLVFFVFIAATFGISSLLAYCHNRQIALN